MIKKSLILLTILLLASFVAAEKISIDVKETYAAGEKITFTVSLYDESNNLVDGEVTINLEDAEKIYLIEKTISSNKQSEIDLEGREKHGYWKLTAKYKDTEATALFNIEMEELAHFEIQEDKLIIKNVGNTEYTRTIQIIIGDSLGTKKVNLKIGEITSFRLIAPDGTYKIKVTDGITTIEKGSVALTGNVIGILDERVASGNSPVTGGLGPDEQGEDFYNPVKNRGYVYVFILVVVGAAVLLAIERKYRGRV